MNIDKKKYWDLFYKKGIKIVPNGHKSTFAEFCKEYGIDKSKLLLDLGCGNCRDSNYFADIGFRVHACDFIDVSKYIKNTSINFIHSNILDLSLNINYGTIYSRLTLDTLDIYECNKVLNWCYKTLYHSGLLCIECTSINDPKYGTGDKIDDNAYIFKTGRLIYFNNKNVLLELLQNIGFEISYINENKNLSITIDDNPVLIRIIAQKPFKGDFNNN